MSVASLCCPVMWNISHHTFFCVRWWWACGVTGGSALFFCYHVVTATQMCVCVCVCVWEHTLWTRMCVLWVRLLVFRPLYAPDLPKALIHYFNSLSFLCVSLSLPSSVHDPPRIISPHHAGMCLRAWATSGRSLSTSATCPMTQRTSAWSGRRSASRRSFSKVHESLSSEESFLHTEEVYIHYRSKVWGHPDNFVSSMKTHTFIYQMNWTFHRTYSQDIDKVRNND